MLCPSVPDFINSTRAVWRRWGIRVVSLLINLRVTAPVSTPTPPAPFILHPPPVRSPPNSALMTLAPAKCAVSRQCGSFAVSDAVRVTEQNGRFLKGTSGSSLQTSRVYNCRLTSASNWGPRCVCSKGKLIETNECFCEFCAF